MKYEKPLVWSYSLLNTYNNCPRKAQAQYITKEIKWEQSSEAAHGDHVHGVLESAVKFKQFPPIPYDNANPFLHNIYSMPYKELRAEQKIGVDRDWNSTEFFGTNVWGRGKLDVTCVLNDTSAILFDWKTGKTYEDPFELQVQSVLLKALIPSLTKVKGCYVWLKAEKWGEVYDLSNFEEIRRKIEGIVDKIEQKIFYAKPNPLCGWCQLKNCAHWKDRNVGK